MKYMHILFIIILCTLVSQANEAKKKPNKKPGIDVSFEYRFSDDLKQTPDYEARLDKWFRDAKFGAFTHFGVYSTLEGQYQDRGSQHRYSEWIQANTNPANKAIRIANQFMALSLQIVLVLN